MKEQDIDGTLSASEEYKIDPKEDPTMGGKDLD